MGPAAALARGPAARARARRPGLREWPAAHGAPKGKAEAASAAWIHVRLIVSVCRESKAFRGASCKTSRTSEPVFPRTAVGGRRSLPGHQFITFRHRKLIRIDSKRRCDRPVCSGERTGRGARPRRWPGGHPRLPPQPERLRAWPSRARASPSRPPTSAAPSGARWMSRTGWCWSAARA